MAAAQEVDVIVQGKHATPSDFSKSRRSSL